MIDESSILESLLPHLLAFFAVASVSFILIWIYSAMAFMALGKKSNLKNPGLAWIPGLGPLIISFQASKTHWWPWLLLVVFMIPAVNILAILVFFVYSMIWNWKLFVTVGKPGWRILLALIPLIGPVVYLIFLGVAAWSKS